MNAIESTHGTETTDIDVQKSVTGDDEDGTAAVDEDVYNSYYYSSRCQSANGGLSTPTQVADTVSTNAQDAKQATGFIIEGVTCTSCNHDGRGIGKPLSYESDDKAASLLRLNCCAELGTPPYLIWAQSLRCLLNSSEGVELFQRYLLQEHCEDSLEFWFACEGLKIQASDAPDRLHQLIKLIYRKYLRSHNAINISSITRKIISQRLADKGPPNQHIFDEAQAEVEEFIRGSTYPNFLKSDIYLQFVQLAQNGHEDVSPRCSGHGCATISDCCSVPSSRSSSSECLADLGCPLATVMEDSELTITPSQTSCMPHTLPLTSKHLIATQRFRAALSDIRKPEAHAGVYLQQNPSRSSNPYHALYASFIPGSAQDSDLQSLSSDAHTDDTISLTDSSVDGISIVNSRKYLRQQHKAMRQNANQNRDSFGHNTFIPRTQRLPTEKCPPSDPETFAAILTQKLEVVRKMQESQEKVNESLRKLEYEENKNFSCRTEEVNHNCYQQQQQHQQQQPLSSVILTAIRDGIHGPDDNVQSILDAHVSRIWDDSCQESPLSRSPPTDRLSPPPLLRSPERRRNGAATAAAITNPYYNNKSTYLSAHQHYRHRKERDVASTLSGDSGAVPDFGDSEMPSSIAVSSNLSSHKHSHHHVAKTKMVAGDIIDYSRTDPYNLSPVDTRRSGGSSDKRSFGKKSFIDSSSSGVDSGVSVAYDQDAQPPSINPRDKVMSWVLESKKYHNAHPSDSEKEYSVRHKKSTYSSSTSPGSNRRSKKQSSFSNSRSGSLERGGLPSRSTAQPSQPIMSDPSMPMLPPPNTTTQLEEARRRLEDDTKAKISKSKSSTTNKERMYNIEMSGKNSRQLSKLPVAGVVSDSLDEAVITSSTKKSSKKQQPSTPTQAVVPLFSSAATIANTEYTSVAYQFIGEPVPYKTKLPGKNIVLKAFKTLITRKSNFRYFFKQVSDEFDSGCVYQEITDDGELLPMFEGKIVARLEAID